MLRHFVCLAALAATMPSAHAHGALAIGLPGNDKAVAGVSFGWTTEIATPDEAVKTALEVCRTNKELRDGVKEACRVVASFDGACFAVAMVKRASTSGFGWAVAPTQAGAAGLAMSLCRETAGANADLCASMDAECDPLPK